MRKIKDPENDYRLEYIIDCINKKSRISNIKDILSSKESILLNARDNYVEGNLNKINQYRDRLLYNLYDRFHTIKELKNIYDSLLSDAVHEKCPYCCGINEPNTLDHYLPRAKYTQCSILLRNLIPSCTQCNSQYKSTKSKNFFIHPYIDNEKIFNEQWIFATITSISPQIDIKYLCKAPDHWDEDMKEKVLSHYETFNLSERYETCAKNEIQGKLNTLKTILNMPIPKENIISILDSEIIDTPKNHWKYSCIKALIEYIRGSY